ncbi:cysteine-rich CWC family protein [Paenibacillus sp. UNC451MF]|uniref:cysteine-rich CWC family protein n=1 Tax=Paenibacillus sp. UNC451MF TaxID=1449063 RepID=UPI0009E0607C|nr:cysteine-rich CWC family protein [Paenibacillus sp. UNC451MF]
MIQLNSEIKRERSCPFCGGENKCSVESGDCWCFHTKVPQELRDRIPAELRGQVCICRKCVEEFKNEQH